MVTGFETESDRSHKKQVAGEELEVALNGLGNIGMVILSESGFPKEGRSEEPGENVDHDERRGEESGGGMRREIVEELREVFAMLSEHPKGVEAEGYEQDLDLDIHHGFDDGITFAQSSGEEKDSRDFVERSDISRWSGSSDPESPGG